MTTTAISTMAEKQASDSTPASSRMVRTITSISPLQDISVPSLQESARPSPASRAGRVVPRILPATVATVASAKTHHCAEAERSRSTFSPVRVKKKGSRISVAKCSSRSRMAAASRRGMAVPATKAPRM